MPPTPFDPVRALDNGVAAALIRTYGADSGTPLPMADDLAMARAWRLAPDALPQAAAGRHDPRGREPLVARPSSPWTWRCAPASEVDDRDVLWNLGNAALQLGDDDAQQHFYSVRPRRGRGKPVPSRRSSTACRGCASAHYLAGDHVAVRSSAEEAIALARASASPR